jgi:hypothetical protein
MTHARKEHTMTIERGLRLVAGLFVFASVMLGMYVHPYFLWFTAFVGLNLLQSGFSNWCPMMALLRGAGLPSSESPPARPGV